MRPLSQELLAGIREVLDEHVAPAVEDRQWPASYLRSIDQLLDHLAVRVDLEGPILYADNADARAVLSELRRSLDLYELGEVLADEWHEPEDYITIEALAEENHSLVAAVERVIALLHEEPQRFPDDVRADAHATVMAYLARRIEREGPLYEPFAGPAY